MEYKHRSEFYIVVREKDEKIMAVGNNAEGVKEMAQMMDDEYHEKHVAVRITGTDLVE